MIYLQLIKGGNYTHRNVHLGEWNTYTVAKRMAGFLTHEMHRACFLIIIFGYHDLET
jgi:hypothetical protein